MAQVLLDKIKGVGPVLLNKLRNLNIWSTYDLILRYPKRYEDFQITDIFEVNDRDRVVLIAQLIEEPKAFFKDKLCVMTMKVLINQNKLTVTIFNAAYLMQQLKVDDKILIKGTINLFKRTIIAYKITKSIEQPQVKPLYGYKDIKDFQISKIVKEIFTQNQVEIFESLPFDIIKKHNLMSRKDAIYQLHNPTDMEHLNQAMYRFKFEESFNYQLQFASKLSKRAKREPKDYQLDQIKFYISQIPYELTDDQKKTVNDIFKDFKTNHVTERLVQGDVGSGKTIVAFLAALGVISSNQQVALMAPTEALAKQHYLSFIKLFPEIETVLLTGKIKEKKEVKKQIQNNRAQMIIGTHALIVDNFNYYNLGLIIVDEQHKFGVSTRESLIEKSNNADVVYLTATPIPRSMAIAYLGYMDYSIIKQKPEDRKEIITDIYSSNDVMKVVAHIKENMANSHQTYVVVPAITSELKTFNISNTTQLLNKYIDAKHLYVLHSKLSITEQETMMKSFLEDQSGVLVATTMIEVGIDCKNATLMVILDAHHFGLSQLHQLRGRVGRSYLESYCYLVTEKTDMERLTILKETSDGFELSKFDLKQRGPGNFIGREQSGFIDYQFLNLATDEDIVLEAKQTAVAVVKQIKKYPYLEKRLSANQNKK